MARNLLLLLNLRTRHKTHFATADGLAAVLCNLHIIGVVFNLLHEVVETFARLCLLHIGYHKAAEVVRVKVVERQNIHNVVDVAYAVHVSVDVYIAISYAAVYALNALDIASAGRGGGRAARGGTGRDEAVRLLARLGKKCAGEGAVRALRLQAGIRMRI